MGSPDTMVFPGALFLETEIAPPTGASQEMSTVPACVTMTAGTTVFPTPPVRVVQADAAGARASAAMMTAIERMALTMPGKAAPFKRRGAALMPRSHGRRQHRRMRRVALLPLLGLALLAGCGGGGPHAPQSTPANGVTASHPVRRVAAIRRVIPVAAGNLANAIQDAAAAPYAGGAVLLGGLTPADVSSDEIVTATRAGSQRVGRIPTALHDSAAVKIAGSAYLFGGGTATMQIDTILMIDPGTGAAQAVGHLPTGSSDQSAAVIGQTAY